MKVFIDSMVYLHYRSIEQIDLALLFGVESVSVVIPRVTLRELDKHKNTHRSSKIRDRAQKVLQKIERWTAGQELRPGVSAEFLPLIPSVDYAKLGLNPDWNDDVLIATIFQYKADHPGEVVTLITQDSGPRMTASCLGIKTFELPAEYKLPFEPDPLEAENRELARTIERLQNALPQLIVCFAGSEEPESHARFILLPPPDSMEEEIARKLDELRAKLPKLQPLEPTPQKKISSMLALKSQLAALNSIGGIAPEEYERYNKDVDAYLTNYQEYMQATWELRAAVRRSIRFEIEIRNTGTAPADDVDVQLHFPHGFRLFSGDDLLKIPKEPRPPIKPRTRMQMITDSIGQIQPFDFYRPSIANFKMPTSFRIKRTGSYDVTDHFTRIKHGAKVVLPEMSLTFDSYESASSFNCDYVIQPANLPEPITGQLHFIVEKKDAKNRIDTDYE
jgi:hypothetical protein